MQDYHGIGRLIQEAVDGGSLGGASICVIRDGEVKILGGYGCDGADSIYKIYSMTKLFTSTVTFQLVEEGVIALGDPVAKYLPEFASHLVYAPDGTVEVERTPLTIQHLLNMTSGIPYPFDGTPSQRRMAELEADEIARAKAGIPFTTRSACAAMASVPGDFEPGRGWEYGAGADLLGGVLEVATGKTLEALFRERVFEPLGMADTGFYVAPEKLGRVAGQFHRDPAYQYVSRVETPARDGAGQDILTFMAPSDKVDVETPAFLSGGGGCYSTAEDYSKLLQMLLNKGSLDGVRLLRPETVEFMATPQLTEEQLAAKAADGVGMCVPGYSYSNLLRILIDPSQARVLGVGGNVGEFGWDGAGGNFCLVDPSEGVTAVFMMQAYECGEPILRRSLYRAIVAGE
ncbi:MAG: serine hydrolase [Atopobiaceae bacterium]|jgi:CubicO group peptidase (beta-lactamase class C family)|nr:beta-lactamase family protein [Atopobiaceae bacterium]